MSDLAVSLLNYVSVRRYVVTISCRKRINTIFKLWPGISLEWYVYHVMQ